MYLAAYLRARLEDPATTGLTVVLLSFGKFLGRRQISERDVQALLPLASHVSVVQMQSREEWRAEPDESLLYLAVGAPGLKVSLRLLFANRRRIPCVVVDEGLGSYGTLRTRRLAGRREGRGRTRALARALTVSLTTWMFTTERWTMYRESPNGWTVDPRVAAEFRRQVSRAGAAAGGLQAVLVGQPWVELGQMTEARLRQVVREVDAACAASGLRLRIRPHPAEDRSRYFGYEVDADGTPIELDPSVVAASLVIGFNSTALLNLAALHQTPVVRLLIPELEPLFDAMSRRQRSLLDAVVPTAVRLDELPAQLQLAAERDTGD